MDKSFSVLHKILNAAGMRQKVIASNLANVDTPGYKSRDVKFGNLLNEKIKLLKTDSKHMSNSSDGSVKTEIVLEEGLSWGDRNNVELNKEIAKMTENALIHNTAIKILSSKIKMYKSAISTRR